MPERLLLSLTAFAAAGAKRDILRRQRRHLLKDMPRHESLFRRCALGASATPFDYASAAFRHAASVIFTRITLPPDALISITPAALMMPDALRHIISMPG
jgi:hypothetical protein